MFYLPKVAEILKSRASSRAGWQAGMAGMAALGDTRGPGSALCGAEQVVISERAEYKASPNKRGLLVRDEIGAQE